MDLVEDLVASFFEDVNKNKIVLVLLLSLLAVTVLVFAFIGARNVIQGFVDPSNNKKKKKTKSGNGSSNTTGGGGGKKLWALLLGGLAYTGPRLYKLVASSPKVVEQLDFVLDGCQSGLREMVVSTASVRDDAVLNVIDRVLDGFQARLRKELRKTMAMTMTEEETASRRPQSSERKRTTRQT